MDPRVLTAYRSLAMAVRNEERAFAFWTYVAAHAEQGRCGAPPRRWRPRNLNTSRSCAVSAG